MLADVAQMQRVPPVSYAGRVRPLGSTFLHGNRVNRSTTVNGMSLDGGQGRKTVVFACVQNAGRSQMAAAWLNALAEPDHAHAFSAGTSPGRAVHPEVVAVMKEAGIDLSAALPRKLTEDLARRADLLVTMGCGESCPYVPGVTVEDWPLPDPKEQPVERVREIRDDIRRRVEDLLRRL